MTELPFPPQALRFMGEDDDKFVRIGDTHLEDAMKFSSPSTVFDLGCGYGRLAYALKRRSFQGRYVGHDILKRHIVWLQENFGDPAYQFKQVDIHNARYNPTGKVKVEDVEFDLPFRPDLTLILSVFTHLYENDIETYLRKLREATHEKSIIIATVFTLSGEPRRRPYRFEHVINDHCRYDDPEDPLKAIAYDEKWLTDLVAQTGFILRDLSYGFQDRMVLAPN